MTTTSYIEFNSENEIKTVSIPAKEVREVAFHTGQLAPFLGKQYSIFLYNTLSGEVATGEEFSGLNPANPNAPPEYFFEVPPKVYELGEPFTSQITPTQRGGKFVESHGSIIKNLLIRGTTGIRPRKDRRGLFGRDFGNIPLVGEAINNVGQQFDLTAAQRNIPSSEQTGFDDIVFLKNIFRAYSDIRENNTYSNHILMIWVNNKDNDSWIVEPKEFKITRSSASPLLYEYSIILETLAPIYKAFNKPKDPLAVVLSTRNVLSRVQEFNQSLRRTFLIVSTQIRRLEAAGVYAQTQLINPIINITKGLGVIRYTGSTFGKRIRHNAQVLDQELDNAIALLTGAEAVEPQDALIRSLRRTKITVSRILTEPGVDETVGGEGSDRQQRYSSSYVSGGDSINQSSTLPSTGGSSTFIGNVSTTDKVGQAVVYQGEDIRAIAGRLLGNRSSWHVLASLNGLSSPYITASGEGNTLKPGDSILYPATGSGFVSTMISEDSSIDVESKVEIPASHQTYGRDLRLVSTDVGGTYLADLYVNQRGDLSTIVGIPNARQGILIKMSTQQGELPAHPYLGAKFPTGSKMGSLALSNFRIQAEAAIYSDSRINKIKRLDFTSRGDVLVVSADLILTDKSDGFNFSVPVRRL